MGTTDAELRDRIHKLLTALSGRRDARRPTGPVRRPARVLMRAGALPALAGGGLVAAGALVVSGGAAGSALLGTLLALLALSAGPALLAVLRSVPAPAAMPLALIAYSAVVVLLGLLYVLLGDQSWLSGRFAGAGLAVATTAWLAGQIRAVPRLRILAYGAGTVSDDDADEPAAGGSPQSPSAGPH